MLALKIVLELAFELRGFDLVRLVQKGAEDDVVFINFALLILKDARILALILFLL